MAGHACDRCDGRNRHVCVPRVDHVAGFFRTVLMHTKGKWARRPFELAKWQRDGIVAPIFGEVEWSSEHARFVRRKRIAWIELARKNGKSELLAGIALVLLCADDEEGAEVYGCACDRDQARKVFDVAQRMVELSPLLSKRLKVYTQAKRLVYERTGSFYEIVAADAAGNLGHNPHGIVFDEVLTQPSRELWDAMRTGMGAREQPLLVAATTAGNNPNAFAAQEHGYCERVSKSPRIDPRRFVFMRNMPEEADPFDERNWRTPNPALGDFLSIEALRDEAREAKLSPEREEAFRQFRCNQWRRQHSRFVKLEDWDATSGLVDVESLRARPVYGGLDLATTTDLAALSWCFPPLEGDEDGAYTLLWHVFAPEDKLPDLDRRTNGEASTWVRNGFLTLTPGNVLDNAWVLAAIDNDAQRFDVREIAYDRWGATQLVQDLQDRNVTVVPIGQGFASMSAPTKEYERLVLLGRVRHAGNPIARWMISHLVVRRDPAGNIKPDKERSAEKIDAHVAAIMALDRAVRHTPPKRSKYEDHGLEVV